MAILKFYLSTDFVGCKREEVLDIPDEELEGLSDDEKDDFIAKNYFENWLINNADFGWYQEDL